MTIKEIVSVIQKEKERNENSSGFKSLIENRLLLTDQSIVDDAHELVEKGLLLFQDDLNKQAKEHFQKSIDLFPTCNAYFLLSMVEFDEDNYYQALRWSIAATMFVNNREFNYWNAFLLRNICILNLLITNNENWNEQQTALKFIFQDYLMPNIEKYESERKNYGITNLFRNQIEIQNINKQDLSKVIPPKGWVYTFTQDNKSELEIKSKTIENLNFIFNSSDHLRYENGEIVSGPHGGAPRAVKVEPNISGNEGQTVTMFNTDGQYVVQMAPKQMKIIQQSPDKIILRGYGQDIMGASFADYGLTIYFINGQIAKCILHMHDRNVDIEYLP